jgi:hypothetical protein
VGIGLGVLSPTPPRKAARHASQTHVIRAVDGAAIALTPVWLWCGTALASALSLKFRLSQLPIPF